MSDDSFSVVSTTDERFETDVLVRSQLGLVIVDFWAEWCAPCRALAPVLEQLAEEFQDQLTLVKADTEQNPVASQQFGVTGIPAVFAVLDGKPIDGFQGALPEEDLRAWINKCLQAEHMFRIKQQITVDPEAAENAVRQLMTIDELGDEAKVMLLQSLFAQGKTEECRDLLSDLNTRGYLEAECERIQAELALGTKVSVDVKQLRSQAEQNPSDFDVRFQLAEVLAAQKQYPEALDLCLDLVTKDRAATGEQARLLMLDVFRIEGDDSDITRDYRRKLSMALY